MTREIRFERLIGQRVCDADGRMIGHLHEVIAKREGQSLVVVEYHLGVYALLHRLADGVIGRALLHAVPGARPKLYRVPWQLLDLSDPERLRVRCRLGALDAAA